MLTPRVEARAKDFKVIMTIPMELHNGLELRLRTFRPFDRRNYFGFCWGGFVFVSGKPDRNLFPHRDRSAKTSSCSSFEVSRRS